MTGLDFAQVPLRPTDFGRQLYEAGRQLVARSGLGLDAIVWDADEVLWDWTMSGARLVGRAYRLMTGDLSHREWFMVRPGIMELLWGMRHEALARGLDPDMRIWTSGYAWRLWRIGREVPGFGELLGLGRDWAHQSDEVALAAVRTSPRIMTRLDFSEAMRTIYPRHMRVPFLASLTGAVRHVIERQLHHQPTHPGFKIPELAPLVGKDGFGAARVLVDDTHKNVRWFAAAGRGAVHVTSFRPTIGFGKVPNTTWFGPLAELQRATSDVSEGIAACLAQLIGGAPEAAAAGVLLRAEGARRAVERAIAPFHIDVPGPVLWREWIAPGRALEKDARRLIEPSDLAGSATR